MTQSLHGKVVAALVTDGFEQVELTGPKSKLVSSRKPEDIPAFNRQFIEILAG